MTSPQLPAFARTRRQYTRSQHHSSHASLLRFPFRRAAGTERSAAKRTWRSDQRQLALVFASAGGFLFGIGCACVLFALTANR